MIIAELKHGVLSDTAELLVRNIGQSVAKNVKVTFAPALPDLEGADAVELLTPFLRRRYSRTIPTFAPGMLMDNIYQFTQEPFEPVADDFTVTITYSDTHERHFVDTYELSTGTIHDQTGSYPLKHGREGDAAALGEGH